MDMALQDREIAAEVKRIQGSERMCRAIPPRTYVRSLIPGAHLRDVRETCRWAQ
jgi:hypothetical protein